MTTRSAPATLTLRRPDDWHLHLRDGDALAAVVGATARVFGRAIVMPNLKPPVTTVASALAYRDRILAAAGPRSRFEPLMTLYLTDNTPPAEIAAAKASGAIHAIKYYPAGATTNSDSGVTAIERAYPAIEAIEKHGLVLSLHGEVTDPGRRHLRPRARVRRRSPRAPRARLPGAQDRPRAHHDERGRAVRRGSAAARRRDRHAAAPAVVAQRDARRRPPAALLLPADPQARGAPPLARRGRDLGQPEVLPRHRQRAACAPHEGARVRMRRLLFGTASRWSCTRRRSRTPARSTGSRASRAVHGASFYGLPPHDDTVTLVRESWTAPAEYPFGRETIVPLRAGETVRWRVAGNSPPRGVS